MWRGILDYILLFLYSFFSGICDCMEEGPVLSLLFPSLSLSPLIGLLKHGVCVCCFVLFVLSECYVVVCEKKIKNVNHKKKRNISVLNHEGKPIDIKQARVCTRVCTRANFM